MKLVEPGDVVLSFADTLIKAVGVASGRAETSSKPTEFGEAGANWGAEGWYVPVVFKELQDPLRPKEKMDVLAQTLPTRYSPLQANGNGNQGVYLAEVPPRMAETLVELFRGQVEEVTESVAHAAVGEDADDKSEQALRDRADIPETTKQQLIKARRGQGLFRSRVELIEPECRVTGISAKEHLRASHIKPWRNSTDAEKLDGNNGLLLAPHVDHLFDRGYITFSDAGEAILSSVLPNEVVNAWNLGHAAPSRAFKDSQRNYLAYHREHIFLGLAGA